MERVASSSTLFGMGVNEVVVVIAMEVGFMSCLLLKLSSL